jgi:pimeloyl-ACP methyl ester carboxylesterase
MRPGQDETAAPELVHSAVVDGVVMRWEEHGGGGRDAVPVVMVHGIPTNPRIWRYVIPRVTGAGVRCLACAAGRLPSLLAPASGHPPGGVCRA